MSKRVADAENLAAGSAERTGTDPGFALRVGNQSAFGDLRNQLTAARKKSGLTQTKVAAAMNTSQSAVAEFETNETNATVTTLAKYATVVGVKITFEIEDAR